MIKVFAFLISTYLFIGYYTSIIPNTSLIQFYASIVSIVLTIVLLKHRDFISVLQIFLFSFCIIGLTYFLKIESNLSERYSEYIDSKQLRIISLFCYSYIIALITSQRNEVLNYIFKYSFFFLLGITIISFFNLNNLLSNERFVLTEEGNPIWTARAFGFIIILSYYFVKKLLIRLILICILLGGILLTRSEGPLFAILIIIVIELHNKKSLNRNLRFALLFITSFLSLLTLYFFRKRIDFNGRDELYFQALDYIKNNPFGNGIGYFATKNYLLYPHNLLLEIGVEFGVLILFLFICVNIYILYRYLFSLSNIGLIHKTLFYLYLFELVNAQFSGDITSPKLLYISMFLLYFNIKRNKNDFCRRYSLAAQRSHHL